MDVCDPQGSWLEAQVIDGAEGAILVHYKGYKARYDEWLNASDPSHPHSARIAPLHTHTRPAVPLPSRPVLPLSALQSSLPYPIDCLDTADDWLPARLLSFDGRTALALVAYDGWSAPYNEYIGIDSYRIAPRGRYSQPTLFVNRVQWADDAASASAAQQNQHAALITRRKSDYAPTVDNEQRFRRLLLTTLRYHIVDQAEDGQTCSQHSASGCNAPSLCPCACLLTASLCSVCGGGQATVCSALCPTSCTSRASGTWWCATSA